PRTRAGGRSPPRPVRLPPRGGHRALRGDGRALLGSPLLRSRPDASRRVMTSNLAERVQTLHEIVKAAKHNLAPGPWDYLMGGTETETTLRRNRQSLDSIAFRPRVLRDVRGVDASSTLFGRKMRLPVMLAPIGSIESFTPGGGATAAVGSGALRVPQVLSSACNPGLEATAAAADNFRIFPLYVRGDDQFVDASVK